MRIMPLPDRAAETPAPLRRWASGVASLDGALGGGLSHGRVHEIYAAQIDDAAAITGFAVITATGMAQDARQILWLRSRRCLGRGGILQANGWAELGGLPGNGLLAVVPDTITLLRAATDALRSGALGAVVAEDWGRMRELDFTASRRLALAAEKSGVPLFLLRVDGEPVTSAAQTRWQVASAPSQALPGNAPGMPTFDIELLRQRSGPSGLSWRLEWDRDRRKFREQTLSGAVSAIPASQSAADTGTGPVYPHPRFAA
jgi:protein ImuA